MSCFLNVKRGFPIRCNLLQFLCIQRGDSHKIYRFATCKGDSHGTLFYIDHIILKKVKKRKR